ncbi:MAG: aminotransferase class V-fold PLP-dependent enzyme [Planctomycetota bacterium]
MSIDTLDLEAEFPVLGGPVTFLNHAAVAPVSGRASRLMAELARQSATQAYLDPDWYPGVLRFKQSAATLINARHSKEIACIPNTTTGIAMLAGGLDWRPGDRVVITNVEYPANRYPWTDLRRRGVEVVEARQGPDLRIDVDDVINLINDRTRVVSVSHVQYATGYRIDLGPIAREVHAAGGVLCVDAIQTIGVMPVDVQALGIDFLAADGHKWMLGPEGAGFLYCEQDLAQQIMPPIAGWMGKRNPLDYGRYDERYLPDARRFEAGTWNVAGLRGLGASLDLLLEVGLDEVWRRVDALCQHLRMALGNEGHRVVSPGALNERSGIVAWLPPKGQDAAKIVELLKQQGIVIASREGRLRASPHFYNTKAQIEKLVSALAQSG